MKNSKRLVSRILPLFIVLFLAVSCGNGADLAEAQETPDQTPTPTEAPMAARVNGDGILLSTYEEELQRYRSAAEAEGVVSTPEEAQQAVLDYLIEREIFVQAARENGYNPDEEEVTQKITELSQTPEGQQDLNAYLSENGYSEASFREAVGKEMAMIWMRNFILDQVPAAAEQVHARQILVNTENEAIAVLRRLEVGTPFSELAFEYDPLTGGELGWFPRGFLFQPAVEEAAFSLQPGQYSGIVQTDFGFHIIEVIERDAERTLSGDALREVQRAALQAWLQERRTQSSIEIYVN